MELKSAGKTVKLLGLVVIIGVIALLIIQIFLNLKQTNTSPYPTPNTSAEASYYSQDYKQKAAQIQQQNQQFNNQEEKVGQLLNKVPYQGTNFKLVFDSSSSEFVVTINQNNKTQGETEFENFLKQNQIEDKSWIRNLRTEYQ